MATTGTAAREVELSGVLKEFRYALREEIEAARRSAVASGVHLLDGRRISASAGSRQYVFRVESALNLPDDSPGDLLVPGCAGRPLETTIVAIDGLAITVSVPEDLGDYVPRAVLQSDLSHLLRSLIERVEEFADRENPAGSRLLGETAASGVAVPWTGGGMNRAQAEAVASALGRDTTFIWGPPGTGKTRTIGAIGNELLRAGRSVLIVSHTNSAVDQALLKVADELGSELIDGSVLRLGEPKDEQLRNRSRLRAETHIQERSRELLEAQEALGAERVALRNDVAEWRRLIAICEWVDQSESELATLRALLVQRRDAELAEAEAATASASAEEMVAEQADTTARARALEQRIREAVPVREGLSRREALLVPAEARLLEAERHAREAEALYRSVVEMNGVMRRVRGRPAPAVQEQVVGQCRAAETAARAERDQVAERLAEVRGPLLELEQDLTAFERERGKTLDAVLRAAADLDAGAAAARNDLGDRATAAADVRQRLSVQVETRLIQLRAWRLTRARPDIESEAGLEAIERAANEALNLLQGRTSETLRDVLDRAVERLRAIDPELKAIEDALAQVETDVIARAMVVATTLTRAYKRDSIQARRFDTVILDEASMAPIPALWVVAGLAEASLAVVGDPKQLPPISHSDDPVAKRWLREDIFELRGIETAAYNGHGPDNVVQLQVQYRMDPRISAIPNKLVYEGRLLDGPNVDDDRELNDWYDRSWGYDAPVLLVDTQGLDAWVTSVRTGRKGGSRLNFLSATLSVDIAEALLRSDRPRLADGDAPRVLIEAPFRPQARLVNLLIQDAGLQGEVLPRTAHTFQGSEAPVVIFDFVLDEPHRQAGLFDPSLNETNLRLLNVALTRARRRLILIGDFQWIEQHANREASLLKLTRFLKAHYPCVNALDVVTEGLHARAAAAHQLVLSGLDAPAHERVVVTQEDFYRYFIRDLDAAESRIVIYSPFLTPDRIGALEMHLRAAAERGVSVYVVTKSLEERPKGHQVITSEMEGALARWGATVVHKFHMHEKLVFIDDAILWSGSLNPLSFSDTQEVMERRESPAVVSDYTRILQLDRLLGAQSAREDRCPVCDGELVAAEARNGDAFYWRCLVPDCYTRSIDAPAPRDGLIPCAACGGPVEFRQTPTGPHWRCTNNRRHRQRLIPAHLRPPRMRELVPKRDLSRLEREFKARASSSSPR
jgi:hypothetical protein